MTTSQADRQIKFRVIHDGTIIGYEQLTTEGWKWMCPDLNPDSGLERWILGVFGNHSPYKRDRFTGLFDKNEKEIYEGDLISDGQHVWLVVFIDGCFWLKRDGHRTTNSMYSWPDNCYPMFRVNHAMYPEVIGNVYANYNLLQG